MQNTRSSGTWIIFFSFFIALLLTGFPLPELLRSFRPEWVSLVLIYWCLALPERINVGVAWCVGLLIDILMDTLLGQHAFTLVLIAFVTTRLHSQIRIYPLWQQALSVFILIMLSDLLVVWVKGIIGASPQPWTHWGPALMSAILWPWLYLILRDIRRKFWVR